MKISLFCTSCQQLAKVENDEINYPFTCLTCRNKSKIITLCCSSCKELKQIDYSLINDPFVCLSCQRSKTKIKKTCVFCEKSFRSNHDLLKVCRHCIKAGCATVVFSENMNEVSVTYHKTPKIF